MKISWKYMVCILLAGCLEKTSIFGAQDAPVVVEKNLILNKPYTYYPNPNYPNCKDEGDRIQLTDGETKYNGMGSMWMLPTTVGWAAGVNVPVVIRFELEEEATLSELRFNTCGGGGAGVVEVGLRVYGSLDNKSYVPIGELPAPTPPPADKQRRIGVQMRVPLNQARAKYIAVVAMAPEPYYFVFVDEIELYGKAPADPKSILPIQAGIQGSSAKELQELLSGGRRSFIFAGNLTAPIERQTALWPRDLASAELKEKNDFLSQSIKAASYEGFEKLRLAFTENHRKRATLVYGTDTLVWETVPDEKFVMLSLPATLHPPQKASVHTVVNALEATALGAANLTKDTQPLAVSVSGGGSGAPAVTPRVARFFKTAGAQYVADALLAADCPQSILPGESRLIWIGVESTGAKPDTYRYEVTVRLGEKLYKIPLEVVVHDVTLSKETPLTTANWAYLNDGNKGSPIYEKARESMFSHRITVGSCTAIGDPKKDAQGNVIRPVEIDFTMLDKYLEFNKDFPLISFFFTFHTTFKPPTRDMFGKAEWMSDKYKAIFKEWIIAFVGHIKSKGRDYNSFYLQMFDETLDSKVAEICKLVHEADPKVRMMITIPQAERSAVQEFVDAGMNVFMYHAPYLGYDNAPDGFPILRSGGRDLWFYYAVAAGCGSGRERDPLDVYRLLHWLAFRHGAAGVTFWNMLNNATSCWTEEKLFEAMVYTIPDEKGNPPPPDIKTSEIVIPSRRWEYTRMGIEDYMLLKMAREKIAALEPSAQAKYQQRLDEIVKAALMNLPASTSYDNRQMFRQKRRELIEMIVEFNGKSIKK